MKHISQIKLNIASSVLLQVVAGVCGLILPRLVLANFGSEANGLAASISQLLSYTVLLEGGIGGVMRAALYKPLANRDMEGVSGIYHQISRSFRKISYIYLLLAFVLAVVMKFLVDTQFDWLYVFAMVIILSGSNYFNYYFALPQWLLMAADQKLYIIQFTQVITTIVKLLVSLMVIYLGGGIHMVKLATALVVLANPLVLRIYVKRNYALKRAKTVETVHVPQKRDGVIHHLAYFVHNNTDIVIISLFSSLANVSVYTVYRSVINILEQLLISISSGVSSTIGNLIARDEIVELKRLLDRYEAWSNALAASFATVCAVLILPFVAIYTNGVSDAQYYQPMFAMMMIGGSYVHSIRHPFVGIVLAAGHYKETKAGAIGEVAINLGLSLLLVKPMGIIGVAFGTFVAMSFRTIYTVWYLSKNILYRPMRKFLGKLFCNLVTSAVLMNYIPVYINTSASNIFGLFVCAIKVSAVVFPVFFGINAILSMRGLQQRK